MSSTHNTEERHQNNSTAIADGNMIGHTDNIENYESNNSSSDGDDSTVSSSSTHSLQIHSSDSDDESTTISFDDDDDLSLGFPPEHITTLTELNELQSQNLTNKLSITSATDQSTINPSILPSYFFCPLSQRIMIDPVIIAPTGNTYERRALLRYFILVYPNYHDPFDIKKPLDIYKDIKEDTLVKGSIDKARKDAWVRYVLNYEEESGETANDVVISGGTREIIPDEVEEYSTKIQHSEDSSEESSENEYIPMSQSPLADEQSQTTSYNKFISYMNSSTDINNESTADTTTQSNHGWQVPLGVHKVSCKGLTVTTDIHRRSNVVKRKIIRKSLATSDTTKDVTKKMKMKRTKKKKQYNVKTTTSIITRDLVLLPGTYVDILETCIHGGRVRGRISFEEEVVTEVDHDLVLALEEEEVRNRCHLEKKDKSSPSKKKLSKAILSPLHRKASKDGHEKNLPFASELFDSVPVQQMNEGQKNNSSISSTDQSSSSTTIKYNGWITLSCIENVNDSNEEDRGPFTQPIPLGVYRIAQRNESTAAVSGSTVKQLPLYETSDSDQIIDFLVHNQCVEVVETQVLIQKKTEGQDSNSSETEQVVRARCMLPVIKSSLSAKDFATGKTDSKPQQKFTSGWITLVDQGSSRDDTSVIPIPLGRYMVTSDEPLLSCDFGSNIKSTHEPGSVFEVVNTRIEFEDDTRTMKCSCCGREGKYHTIAVRALIATGGYVTILVSPVGGMQGADTNLCVCGQLVQPLSYAKPAPYE